MNHDMQEKEVAGKKTPMWHWFMQKMQTRYAETWLATYSFFETALLPVPTDIFLALMVFANRRRVVYLTVLTTVFSLLGATVLYFITVFFNDVILQALVSTFGFEADIARASEAVQGVAFIAIFIAAFSPIPYTPAIIAAALLDINFFIFFAASLLGRGIRYMLVSFLVYIFGVSVLPNIQKTSIAVTTAITFLLVAAWLLFQFFT